MADTTIRLSRTQSLHLIELYHGHTALWNICSPQYKDRNVQNTAYISVQLGLEDATTIKLSGSDPWSLLLFVVYSHSDSDSGVLLGCEGDSINKLKAMLRFWNVGNISDTWLACYAI